MKSSFSHAPIGIAMLFLIALSSSAICQQQEKKSETDELLKLKTELIEIRAVVTDKQNRPIEGLKKEDFELAENGRQQEIAFFSELYLKSANKHQTDQPAAGAPVTAKSSNSLNGTERWVILFIDTLHLSGESLIRLKQMLRRYVNEQLTDQDAVMILTSSGNEAIAAHFTKAPQILRYFIDRLTNWQAGQTSYFTPTLCAGIRRGDPSAIQIGTAIYESEEHISLRGLSPSIIRQILETKAMTVLSLATHKRKNLLAMLKAAVGLMAKLTGQRLLVLFSDGFTLMDTQGSPETQGLQPVTSRAARSGVVINSISVKGLQPPAEFDASRPDISANSSILGLLSSMMSDSEKDDRDGLNALAMDTGGKTFFNTNDLDHALQTSIEENRRYYVLSYYPANEKNDDKFRAFSLRIKGHPDYLVRTQKGFIPNEMVAEKTSAKASPQKRFFETIAAPLPSTAVNISATAAYLESANDRAQVSIEVGIEGTNLNYREESKQAGLNLEIGGVIYDRAGSVVKTYTEKIQGKIPLQQLPEAKKSGFRYGKRFELKPGVYQFRIGVRDEATDLVGTGITWVQVPDLSKGQLTTSNILLTDLGQPSANKESDQPVLSEWRAIKSYKSESVLIYYLMLYNLAEKDEGETLIQSEILHGEKSVYQSTWQPLASRTVGKEKKGLELGGQIQLFIPPGVYELRVSIKKSQTDKTTRQSTVFSVED